MATRRPSGYPSPPDLPPEFDEAPASLQSRALWDCVEAGESVDVAAHVADVQLRECLWHKADLVGRRLSGLRATDVRFVGCDLSGALLEECRLTRVSFESCRLAGAVLSGAHLEDVHLLDCSADLIVLRMAHVSRSAAERCSLRGADLYQAELREVRLVDSDLSRTSFEGMAADGLRLNGSTVEEIIGARSLGGAHIDADQVVPIGAALVAELGLRIT